MFSTRTAGYPFDICFSIFIGRRAFGRRPNRCITISHAQLVTTTMSFLLVWSDYKITKRIGSQVGCLVCWESQPFNTWPTSNTLAHSIKQTHIHNQTFSIFQSGFMYIQYCICAGSIMAVSLECSIQLITWFWSEDRIGSFLDIANYNYDHHLSDEKITKTELFMWLLWLRNLFWLKPYYQEVVSIVKCFLVYNELKLEYHFSLHHKTGLVISMS